MPMRRNLEQVAEQIAVLLVHSFLLSMSIRSSAVGGPNNPFRLSFFVTDGGLISYGPDFVDQWRRAAGYVDSYPQG